MFRAGTGFLRTLYQSRHMIGTMAVRDLKARYVGSAFGLFWAVAEPLLLMGVYGTVFGVFLNQRPDPVYGTDSYVLFLFAGLMPWLFFAETVNRATASVNGNRNLVKKAVGFPVEILPIITLTTNVISHLIGVGLLLAVTVLVAGKLTVYTLLIVPYLFFAAVFGLGLGWLLSGLNVYLKDVSLVLAVVMRAWFFFTPILYPVSRVPDWLLHVLQLNPMFHVVEGYRYALLVGSAPPVEHLAYLALAALVSFGVGGLLFRRLKPGFADVL